MTAPLGREAVMTIGPDGQRRWHVVTIQPRRNEVELRAGTELTARHGRTRIRYVFDHGVDVGPNRVALVCHRPGFPDTPVEVDPRAVVTVHRTRTEATLL